MKRNGHAPAPPRPTVELSPAFCQLLQGALAEHPQVKAALLGVYEGRGLTGNYRLHILGARLEPAPDGQPVDLSQAEVVARPA